jgi:hypothetical protein
MYQLSRNCGNLNLVRDSLKNLRSVLSQEIETLALINVSTSNHIHLDLVPNQSSRYTAVLISL